MEKKPIYDLHSEHKEWQNKLRFYADDLKIMQNRISEVASKNNGKEVQAMIEHFQNQLILQKENIDTLMHNIKDHEIHLENKVDQNPVAVDHKKLNDHPMMRDAVESFEKDFNELRKELLNFLCKWM